MPKVTPIDFPKRPVMNDKIEHCLYESGLTAQGCWDELDDYAKQSILRFAELIVQETIKEMASQMLHFGMDESNNPAFYKAVNKVKEHFGVE